MNKQSTREQLPSKKNYVYRDRGEGQDIVIKTFTDQSRFQTEKEIGDLLDKSGLLIPSRFSIEEESLSIVYAYVDGSPVVDLIEEIELSQAEEIISKICEWLLNFYSIIQKKKGCQYILGDIHLRNFLYEEASNRVYGLDFEECRPGRIETDAARLYVFILHYEPAFTPRKKVLADYLRKSLSASLVLDETFFQQEVKRESEELLVRRQKRLIPSPLMHR